MACRSGHSIAAWMLLLLADRGVRASGRQCLASAIPEASRKHIQTDEGQNISIGVFPCNWASSFVMNEMAVIWISEVLGYHAHLHSQAGAIGASAIYALAGCDNFDDAESRSCGVNETLIHVSTDTWVGSYAAVQEAFVKENPQIAAVDLGSMGYAGEESIYLSQNTLVQGQEDGGLALDFYKSYNTTHHDPKKYFDSLSDVNQSELALCSDTDFSNKDRMNAYARFSGDYDGMVEQPDGSYIAKCPDGRWWPAPACRNDLTKCIPTFTASPGWKLQAMMQWTAAYGFPAAIAISSVWANFEKQVRDFRALHYWWVPDSTFIEMLPSPVIFPRHVASEWAAGDKKTGGAGSYVSKMVSRNLQSKARLVQDFVAAINFELPEVQELLLIHKKSGAADYYDVACDWIKANEGRWSRWVPDKTQCTAQFGLYNEQTKQFVSDRVDPTNLACLACPSGHYSLEIQDEKGATFICKGCPVGTSQASGASLACDPCPTGEYQDEEAKSECKRCAQGFFQSQEGQSQCAACPPSTTTLGYGSQDLSECGCKRSMINMGNGTDFDCVDCSDGLQCPFHSSIQHLKDGTSNYGQEFAPKVLRGYYASMDDPTSVFRCEPSSVCPGGTPGMCNGGLEGEPCAICPAGQFFANDQCSTCAAASLLWPIGILCAMGALFLFYYAGNVKVAAQASSMKVVSMACGLGLNVMQTVALMGVMTVEWTPEMETTSSGLQFMVLDIRGAGLQCLYGRSAIGRYVAICMVFPAAILWLFGCKLLTSILTKCGPLKRFESYAWIWPKTLNIQGMLLQVGFSTICAVVLQPMTCYSNPNGQMSVLKYPNVMCGSGEQTAMLVVGMAVGSIFVLAFFGGCLYAARKIPTWSQQRNFDLMVTFRFFTSNFRLDRWWFGLFLLGRGFGFAVAIAVATDTPAAQTSLATLILVIYGFAQATAWPWKASLINVCDAMFSALMLLLVGRTKLKEVVVEVNPESHHWNFTRVFTFLILILMLICLVWMMLASCVAFLLVFFRRDKSKKTVHSLLNLRQMPVLSTVAAAMLQMSDNIRNSEKQTLIDNLGQINHYDMKAIWQAIGIFESEIVDCETSKIQQVHSARIVLGLRKMKTSITDIGDATSAAATTPSPTSDDNKPSVPAVPSPGPADVAPLVLASAVAEKPSYDFAALESVGISVPTVGEVVATEL